MTSEEEIKLRLFECIAANTNALCAPGKYMTPENVAVNVNAVYDELFRNNEE